MKKFGFVYLALIFVLIFSLTIPAQDKSGKAGKYDAVASNVTGKLQQKILLSDKQTSEIKGIVEKYIAVKDNLKDPSKLVSEITPLLNSRQKIKFEIIQNDWWGSIIKELNTQDSVKSK